MRLKNDFKSVENEEQEVEILAFFINNAFLQLSVSVA